MIFALYHGSYCIVEEPKIIKGRYTKDFGQAFYCTRSSRQAKKFALRRRVQKGDSYVNFYLCSNVSELKVKEFNNYSEEWLDFVTDCRNGIPHSYDIVIGPVADDAVHRSIEEYNGSLISKNELFKRLKYTELSNQVAFCTNKAISRLIFKGVI